MPLETASYINGLVATNPASTDTVSQADDHIRLIKQVLKDTFPNLNAPVTATPAQLNAAVPTGFIGMWSGSVASIPSGWALCDGTSGRPDLRNRFIVGAGSSYSPGATGGADSVALTTANLPSHSHTFSGNTGGHSNDHSHSGSTSGAGAHSHGVQGGNALAVQGAGGSWFTGASGSLSYYQFGSTDGVGDHAHSFSTGGVSANHTHGFSGTTSAVGSGSAIENRPPYYALAFIIKL